MEMIYVDAITVLILKKLILNDKFLLHLFNEFVSL